jgi:transcriptional regulator with PAS, ATPase and Fis domain
VLDRSTPIREANGVFAGYLGLCVDVTEQVQATQEVERSRDKLRAENLYLQSEVKDRLGSGVIVGQSPAMRRVLAQVEQVAGTNSTVLILGETGTGKELFATRIHELSGRRTRPMVRVNCSAIPSTLIESELFGREKGAFTGALARQAGRFELADHSTIFPLERLAIAGRGADQVAARARGAQIERLGSPGGIPSRAHHRGHAPQSQQRITRNISGRLLPAQRLLSGAAAAERVETFRRCGPSSSSTRRRSACRSTRSDDNLAMPQRYDWPGNIREPHVERAMIVASSPRLTITLPTNG